MIDETDSTELTMKAQCPPIGNPTQKESLGNSSGVIELRAAIFLTIRHLQGRTKGHGRTQDREQCSAALAHKSAT